MTKKPVVVGDAGRGIAEALLGEDRQVIAARRTCSNQNGLRSEIAADAEMQKVIGSVAGEEAGKTAAGPAVAFNVPHVVRAPMGAVLTNRRAIEGPILTVKLHE
jgi:hypothetical protein